MKKLIYPLIYIACSMLTSCSDSFLEVVPMGQRVASTTADYDLLMNNMDFYRDQSYSINGWLEPQLMGDEAAASGAYLMQSPVHAVRLFQWQGTVYQQNDQIPTFLRSSVTNIYTFNKVIAEVMDATNGTTQQKEILRAEARASRAWTNFQMINYYAKPYAAATAATDPGFPIIDKADATIPSYNRGTVQQMYDFIISDLTEAIKVLPVTPRIRTRFSKAAAEGLLGKVYLFMGRTSDALPLLNAAFADLAQSEVKLYDYNVTLGPNGTFLPADPNYGPAGPGNDFNDFTEDILSKIFTNDPQSPWYVTTRGLGLTAQAAALFDSRDLRLKLYSSNTVDGTPDPNGLLRKYGVRYSRFGLQLSELYLLRAECKARLDDLTGAVADLEMLRRNRMPADAYAVPAVAAGDKNALVHFVIDERIREFALEGYRWFDMRRLSVDPLFAGITFTHTVYNADGTVSNYTLQQPDRLVMQIPELFILSNPGMQNNP
ncbi:RagB/SusD family nutrient uptake outer membrane protein [uncultured Chitinophaga sp.]|uniref:RagB/SusD family nutrient uptake outer membrane protein n=1 Tax=uncultured Chitinophaga sp. TaxID=339340 RepID=UPI0025D2FABA|nr:RagB/SusD family nutrient uptake outer membrane protein [uncultured Chitinophaga sp.]